MDKDMWWKQILENIKLIAGTITVVATLMVGGWTIVTNIFLTKADAQQFITEQKQLIKKIDLDTAYNKAFRLETKIRKYKQKEIEQGLDQDEYRALKRLERDLNRTDHRIDVLEQKVYIKEEKENQ